ncbi:MAG: alpha/beta hydrolase [Gammaproteobacteria bacterium]|nr:alpha/beta hydrolase [Gammaproteobacteria bacterium]
MPKIKINDITMYYEIHGKGEPLVFVSGFGADHLGWTPVLDAFSADYQVILFNNRGVGQTSVPKGPYSIDQMAKDIADLCSALNINNAHFIGNSMGGCLVQTLAYQYPSLVKSIVISNSAMTIHSVFGIYIAAHLELMKANAQIESLLKSMCSWVFSFYYLSKPGNLEILIQLGKNNPYPFSIAGYEAQYAALDAFDSRAWVQEIKVPVLIITADQDIVLSPILSNKLLSEIKHAKFYCFENCGHLPHIENPRKYSEVVKLFLSRES